MPPIPRWWVYKTAGNKDCSGHIRPLPCKLPSTSVWSFVCVSGSTEGGAPWRHSTFIERAPGPVCVAGPMEESETREEVGPATHHILGALSMKVYSLQGAPSPALVCGGVTWPYLGTWRRGGGVPCNHVAGHVNGHMTIHGQEGSVGGVGTPFKHRRIPARA